MNISRLSLALIIPLGIVLAACAGDDKGEETDIPTDDTADDTDTDDCTDQDGDGVCSDEDCDDLDASVYPGAEEVCDGIDNDCNNEIDEGVTETYYDDADGDGFGDPESSVEACEALSGTVPNSNDCDDADDTIHPGADELCDGLDNDCDDIVDNDLTSATWYADADGDGYGDPDTGTEACEQPTGFVDNDWDCNDADALEPVHVSEDGSTWSKKFAPAPDTSDTAGGTGTPATGDGTQDAPYENIQEGINASNECVFVFSGTYNEDIDFNGKDIAVTGVEGAESTIIEGTGNGPVVTFDDGESSSAILSEFTITGGTGKVDEDSVTTACYSTYDCTTQVTTYFGGGIYVDSSSPSLDNLIVTDNVLPSYSYTASGYDEYYVYSFGGGMYVTSGGPTLESVSFNGNGADSGGGVFSDTSSTVSASHVVFDQNAAATGGGVASAGAFTASNSILVNNTTTSSGASYGGAGIDVLDGAVVLTNLSMVGNDGLASVYVSSTGVVSAINTIAAENSSGYILDGDSGSSLTLTYSDIYSSTGYGYGSAFSDLTGTDGNIDDDPVFAAWSDDEDYSNDDLALDSSSPAVDAGSTVTAYDDVDGTRNDMGAYGGPQGDW